MHTYQGQEGTVIHHNGNPEGGPLLINVPATMMTEQIHVNGEVWVQVSISANDIIDFVLDRYVTDKLIGWLEQTQLRRILHRFPG